jgi:hypothetical protein
MANIAPTIQSQPTLERTFIRLLLAARAANVLRDSANPFEDACAAAKTPVWRCV